MVLCSCFCHSRYNAPRNARLLQATLHLLNNTAAVPTIVNRSLHTMLAKHPSRSQWSQQIYSRSTTLYSQLYRYRNLSSVARTVPNSVDRDGKTTPLQELTYPRNVLDMIVNHGKETEQKTLNASIRLESAPVSFDTDEFNRLLQQRELSRALEMLINSPKTVDIHRDTYQKLYDKIGGLPLNELISLVRPWRQLESSNRHVWGVLDDLFRSFDDYQLNQLIQHLANNPEDERLVLHLYGAVTKKYRAVKDYNVLLSAIPTAGDLSKTLLVRMYNKAIDECVRERQRHHVDKIVAAMMDKGVSPDPATYNIFIRSQLRGRNEIALRRATSVFEEMKKQGIDPTPATYNTFLKFAVRRRLWDQVLDWVNKMDPAVHANTITLRILLEAAVTAKHHRGIVTAFETISRHVEIKGYEELLHPAIVALLRHKRTETALFLLERIFHQDREPVTLVSYNILIHALCQRGQIDEAHKILHAMTKHEGTIPRPDVVSFTTLIHGYVRHHLDTKEGLDAIVQLYEDMLSRGLQSTPTLHAVLLYSLSKSRIINLKSAERLFRLIIKELDERPVIEKRGDLLPQTVVYNIMMDAYFIQHFNLKMQNRPAPPGLLIKAYNLLDEAQRKGIPFTTVTLNIWMRGLALFNNQLYEAEELLQWFQQTGIRGDERTTWYLTRAASRANRSDLARDYLQRYESSGAQIEGRGLRHLKRVLGAAYFSNKEEL